MRNLVLGIASCLAVAGCGSTTGDASGNAGDGGIGDARVLRAQEGHACSTDPGVDPQLVCTPAQDLVCIATYTRLVTNPQEAVKFDGGVRPVFVCRMPCATDVDCPQAGDICCPGRIYGKTFDRMAGCVPPGSCEAEPPADGGA